MRKEQEEIWYHISPAKNHSSIMARGLRTKLIGPGAGGIEGLKIPFQKGLWLVRPLDEAISIATVGLLWDPQNIYEVRLPAGTQFVGDPGDSYEYELGDFQADAIIVNSPIPPSRIRFVKRVVPAQ